MADAEFALIERIRARVAPRADVLLGIGDDAALLQPPSSRQLVVTADTLNAGVHFPEATRPEDIGWKTLAVNLSDLAAMGAQPAWCTLSLSLPRIDPAWLDGFLEGFLELAALHGIAVVGGDTTRGPLSLGVTAMGFVEPGRALRRDGAQAGDDVWVTGTPGDAAAALQALLAGAALDRSLRARLDRPQPRVEAGLALAGIASACIDVSDGLLADLGHVCARSGVAAEIDIEAVPASPALQRYAPALRRDWQAAGGDDYELCFSAPVAARERIAALAASQRLRITRIGRIREGAGVCARDAQGQAWQPARRGYEHFA